MLRPFRDRKDAGEQLAMALANFKNHPNLLILGLPRGGVVVAHEVAKALNAPLDVFIVRKLGMPGQEEFAMGAIASGGVRVLSKEIVEGYGIPKAVVDEVISREEQELERREKLYRGSQHKIVFKGKEIILIDDGLATGATMNAAVMALKQQSPKRMIIAVPVASPETCEIFRRQVDKVVCLYSPEPFYSVGSWYESFQQTSDEEVQQILNQAKHREQTRHAA